MDLIPVPIYVAIKIVCIGEETSVATPECVLLQSFKQIIGIDAAMLVDNGKKEFSEDLFGTFKENIKKRETREIYHNIIYEENDEEVKTTTTAAATKEID